MSPKKKHHKPHPMKVLRDRFAAFKPLAKMIADGDVCDIVKCAELTGYSEAHLRRLCHDEKVGHLVRNGNQFYFAPEHVEALRPKPVSPKSAA